LLQNGILHFVFRLSQLSEIELESYLRRRKTNFSERGLALKGLGYTSLIFNRHKTLERRLTTNERRCYCVVLQPTLRPRPNNASLTSRACSN